MNEPRIYSDDIGQLVKPAGTIHLNSTTQTAKRVLADLEVFKKNISIFAELKSLYAIIHGAVAQAASGRAEYLHISLADKMLSFESERQKLASRYGSMSCYSDVLETRDQLKNIQEISDVFEQIAAELIDYSA